jgi:hypothetical protein
VRTPILSLVLFVSATTLPPPSLPGGQAPPPSATAAAENLLDRLQQAFEGLERGSSEIDIGHDLSTIANGGRDCLAGGIVSPDWHARFARLLLVVKLATITDTGKILAPIRGKEFTSFVYDITGAKYDPDGPPSEQIAQFSEAVATERTRLYVELIVKR